MKIRFSTKREASERTESVTENGMPLNDWREFCVAKQLSRDETRHRAGEALTPLNLNFILRTK